MESYAPVNLVDEDPRAAIIAQMVNDLGWCLNSYGQIEYLFGDIIWHAASMDEYRATALPFPNGLSDRAKRLRKLLAQPGRLDPYAQNIGLLIGRLEQLSEPRHLFVHGHTTFVYTSSGDAGMLFRRFVPPLKGGAWTRVELLVRPEALHHGRILWCLFASTAQRIIGSMYLDLGIEEVGALKGEIPAV